jgi:sec-independent protein translocase protein TatA
MLGLGPTELILILIVVLFFYGGRRFPEIGDGIGKSITAFKKAIKGDSEDSPDREKKTDKRS